MPELRTRADFSKLSRPAVVDIWAPWCGPCRSIRPLLSKLAVEYSGSVDLIEVNADQNPELVRELGIHSIPTLLALSGGSEVTRMIGAQSPARLSALFEAAQAGQALEASGPASFTRILQVVLGTGLIVLGLLSGPSWLLIVIGGAIGFLAIRDRCPIWQALSPRLAKALHQLHPGERPPGGR